MAMGLVSARLRERFLAEKERKVIPFSELVEITKLVSTLKKTIKTPQDLKGYDPVHALYISVQNMVSLFAEQASLLPEMKEYYRIMDKAERVYMPDGPPISPLTRSYFTHWAFFDATFGKDKETIGTCLLDLGELTGMDPHFLSLVGLAQKSRMGIYEYIGCDHGLIELREFLTDRIYPCICPSGYPGREGEIWFVRIHPPPFNLVNYSVIMTTPYILMGHSKQEWVDFFERNSIGRKDSELEVKLQSFLKHGRSTNYWNEFIVEAYAGYRKEAIFLQGIHDLANTRPHAPRKKKKHWD
jgi:hypothetical protein